MATIPGSLSDQSLSDASKALINSITFVNGEVSETNLPGAGVFVTGQGGNQNGTGVLESQGIFLNQGTDAPVSAQITDGVLTLTVTLPPGVDLAVKGPSVAVDPSKVQGYINGLIDMELPAQSADPAVAAHRAILERAIAQITEKLAMAGASEVAVRVITFADASNAASGSMSSGSGSGSGNTVVFDAGEGAGSEVLALLLNELKAGTTVSLKNVENAMLVGSGSVAVDGDQGVFLHGDLADQKIVGSTGNDTLVGGGGNDTLVGGGGEDVIGFNALGHYTVEMSQSDKLAFVFDGVDSIADLVSHVTNVTEANGNTTFEFGHGAATITLIGMSESDIIADMVQFTL